jgi:hypothetical protein
MACRAASWAQTRGVRQGQHSAGNLIPEMVALLTAGDCLKWSPSIPGDAIRDRVTLRAADSGPAHGLATDRHFTCGADAPL